MGRKSKANLKSLSKTVQLASTTPYRVILIAEDYDYEVLVTSEWLNEQYGLDIRCYRLSLSVDSAGEYLSVTRSYPPQELTDRSNPTRQEIERDT